jgi:hypothetical protein
MTATVPLERLTRADQELQALEMKFPDAYSDLADFFERNRALGYKNLCRLLLNEQTPEELKGVDEADG